MTDQQLITPVVAPTTSTAVVYVIDDDETSVRHIAAICEAAGLTVKTYSSAESFLYDYHDTPGCVICNTQLRGISGIELQAEFRRLKYNIPTLMMGQHASVRTAVESMEAGAITFLEKPIQRGDLLNRVTAAIQNDQAKRVAFEQQKTAHDRYAQLTAKEREVVDRVMQGLTNREISSELGISVRAVEDRRSRIMRRMQADSLVHLVDLVRAAEQL